MMTLEIFNEHVLKGKNVEELYDLIEDFKIEKVFLKLQIEKENIAAFTLPPTEMMSKINSYRLYIRDTYRKIEKIGGTTERADDEEVAIKFQENIPNIYQIDYQIGGYFEGNEKYRLTFEADQVIATKHHSHEKSSPINAVIDNNTFLKEFSALHIGEWRDAYADSDYGEEVMDGTTWSLKVHFSGEMNTTEFVGSNAFPYNFGTLDQLIKKIFNK